MALSTFFCAYVITNISDGYMADKHGGDKIIFYGAFDVYYCQQYFAY